MTADQEARLRNLGRTIMLIYTIAALRDRWHRDAGDRISGNRLHTDVVFKREMKPCTSANLARAAA